MHIFPVESGPVDTIGYLVASDDDNTAIIIDAPKDSEKAFLDIIKEKGFVVKTIILTHSHWDHMADAAELKRSTDAPVCIHQDDAYRLANPNKEAVWELPFEIDPVAPDFFVVHGEIIKCGPLNFEVRHTPGHTEGGICLVEHKEGIIFSGDTIFFENIGRINLPGGSGAGLVKSIKEQIFTLPDNFRIFPGHGIPTSVGYEKENNLYINNDSWL
jgi:glyoxylase-like metal-dependent hydrolase (beta-lactamase superfamily II)